jgi:hypothetical protein
LTTNNPFWRTAAGGSPILGAVTSTPLPHCVASIESGVARPCPGIAFDGRPNGVG